MLSKMNFRIVKGSDWTLFLDRDGVINERNFGGYITKYEDIIFRPGSLESIAILRSYFKRIIVVTNQQCVAKGLISESELDMIHEKMCNDIKKAGGYIDEVLVAKELKNQFPFHRKPNSTMALMAKDQFEDIQFEKSMMVGDTDSDIEFGKNLGMKTVLVKSAEKTTLKADIEINDLINLCDYLES